MLITALLLVAAAPVVTFGEAVVDGDERGARNAAIQSALEAALRQKVGVTIESRFFAHQAEHDTRLTTAVDQILTARTSGWIERFEVLHESRVGDRLRVKVSALVHESKAAAELETLAALLVALDHPKIALRLPESLHTPVTRALIERGFTLVTDGSADVVLDGRLRVKAEPIVEDRGFSALAGQVRLHIDTTIVATDPQTGEVLATAGDRAISVGLTAERAEKRAFEGKGKNVVTRVVDDLLGGLAASLKKARDRGRVFFLDVSGLASYREQVLPLLEELRNIEGVREVRQTRFDAAALLVELRYAHDGTELTKAILRKRPDLDVESANAQKLELRARPPNAASSPQP